MEPNIGMKFAGYVAWILLCKRCKFGEKNYYNSRDIEFFLGDYFFGMPCILQILCIQCITINFACVKNPNCLRGNQLTQINLENGCLNGCVYFVIPVCWKYCLTIWMQKLLLEQSPRNRRQWITSRGLISSVVWSWIQGELMELIKAIELISCTSYRLLLTFTSSFHSEPSQEGLKNPCWPTHWPRGP